MSIELTPGDIQELRRAAIAAAEYKALHPAAERKDGRAISVGKHCHECGADRVSGVKDTGEWLCFGCGASDGGTMLPNPRPAHTRIDGELDRLRGEHSRLIHEHSGLLAAYADMANCVAGRCMLFGIIGVGLGFMLRWVFWL